MNTNDEDRGGGLVPAQVILRLMMLALVALGVAATIASRDDIARYVKIKQM